MRTRRALARSSAVRRQAVCQQQPACRPARCCHWHWSVTGSPNCVSARLQPGRARWKTRGAGGAGAGVGARGPRPSQRLSRHLARRPRAAWPLNRQRLRLCRCRQRRLHRQRRHPHRSHSSALSKSAASAAAAAAASASASASASNPSLPASPSRPCRAKGSSMSSWCCRSEGMLEGCSVAATREGVRGARPPSPSSRLRSSSGA